jgi:hypothetical protein
VQKCKVQSIRVKSAGWSNISRINQGRNSRDIKVDPIWPDNIRKLWAVFIRITLPYFYFRSWRLQQVPRAFPSQSPARAHCDRNPVVDRVSHCADSHQKTARAGGKPVLYISDCGRSSNVQETGGVLSEMYRRSWKVDGTRCSRCCAQWLGGTQVML